MNQSRLSELHASRAESAEVAHFPVPVDSGKQLFDVYAPQLLGLPHACVKGDSRESPPERTSERRRLIRMPSTFLSQPRDPEVDPEGSRNRTNGEIADRKQPVVGKPQAIG